MGKKTKKKGSSSSSAAASKAEKDLKRVARRSLIDKHGRMPREDGIRFYALLDFVALIVIDDVENERRFRNREYWTPLNWPERDGLQKMPNAARTIVLNYIWQNIHRITDEIDAGRHDELFLTKVGRRIEEKDKSEIRSWRNHIKDDFIVIDHLPHRGSVFVHQVGRVTKFEQSIERQPIKDDSDIHDPRVFLIQGLATPLKELCEGSHEELTKKFPSLKKKYDLPISIIHATIIPYNKGVTIGVTAEQQNCHYYETPQQYAEAVNIAHDCYELTVLKNNQETTTSNSSPCCKLYHTITRDIVRQAKPSFNVRMMHEKLLREEVQVSPDDHKNDPEMTRLVVHGIIWMPFQNTDFAIDPRTVDVIKEVTLSERPLKVVREGFKHRIKWELWCNDHHPCPFHRHIGGKGTTLSFAKCCKEDHLKRVAKAKKRREDLISSYWY